MERIAIIIVMFIGNKNLKHLNMNRADPSVSLHIYPLKEIVYHASADMNSSYCV